MTELLFFFAALAADPCPTSDDLSELSGRIVYEGDPVEGPDPKRGFEVWVVEAPEWEPRLVGGGPGFDGHPAWSPDRAWIVYSSHGGRSADLYVVRFDGSERRQLTSAEGDEDYPLWLPEGIVYRTHTGWEIIDPEGGPVKPFGAITRRDEQIDLSPDRERIAVVRRSPRSIAGMDFLLLDRAGETVRTLPGDGLTRVHPRWSPDSTRLLYSEGDGTRDGEWDVFMHDVATDERVQLTNRPGPDWTCGFSPDGAWVLIASAYDGNWDLYAIRPDGSGRIRITCHAGNARGAAWAAEEKDE